MSFIAAWLWPTTSTSTTSVAQVKAPKPTNDFPALEEEPSTYGLWGDVVTDPFPFLENTEDPRTIKFLSDMDTYTQSKTAHLDPLVAKIKGEIAAQKFDTKTVGNIDLLNDHAGSYEYYWMGTTYYQPSADVKADPVIVLTEGEASEACGDFEDWGYTNPSPDGNYVAFSLDHTGGGKYAIYIKDLKQNKILPDCIDMTDGGVIWCKDNTLCYIKLHENNYRPYKACLHTMGTPTTKDSVIFVEKDEQFVLSTQSTYSDSYFLLASTNYDSSEVRVLNTANPEALTAPMAVRKPGFRYSAVLHENGLYIRASDKYSNFKLYKAKVEATSANDWTLCPTADNDITDITPFANQLVLSCRRDGLPQFTVYDVKTGEESPFEGYARAPTWSASASNYNFYGSNSFVFNYSDPLTPTISYAYGLTTQQISIIQQTKVSGSIDVNDFKILRETVKAKDGKLIPIDMIFSKKITNLQAHHPMVVEAYGAYGICFDANFNPEIFPLLQRGVVYMYPHVRGGSEMGEEWYAQGKGAQKVTTFDDFDTCLRYAVDKGYTTSGQLAARGKSAGGFLIGYQMTRDNPVASCFLNRKGWTEVLKTMCEPNVKYANTEKSEWGDPNVKADYLNLKALSPENRVENRAYPACLTIGAKDDTDVPIDVEARWVALVQKHHTGNSDQLLRYEPDGGHYDDDDSEMPFEFAFVLDKIGAAQ